MPNITVIASKRKCNFLFLADHIEQPLNVYEEKRKISKSFQNGISPSDPSTQTLVKEVKEHRLILSR